MQTIVRWVFAHQRYLPGLLLMIVLVLTLHIGHKRTERGSSIDYPPPPQDRV